MSCTSCGDCCDPVHLTVGLRDRMLARPEGFIPADVAWVKALLPVESDAADGELFTCPAFDRESRLCGRYEDRPPVCSGFPWYGSAPRWRPLDARCGFWSEVPVALAGLG